MSACAPASFWRRPPSLATRRSAACTSVRDWALSIGVAFTGSLLACGAMAQTYPTRPVRVIVPVQPGGGLDTQMRLVGRKLQEALGQTFVIENRPGANSMIGTEAVVRAAPDGYTLLCAAASLASAATLNRKLPFDPLRDLAPVAQLSSTAQLLVVHPSLPARSVPELIALGKRHADGMNAGSGGTGSANHLALEMLKLRTGIRMTHIPYKGSGPATVALISGEVDFSFAGSVTSLPHIRSGRIRALAVTTPKPSAAVPGVPTLASFYPGFEAANWYALFAPAATPAPILNKLSTEIANALKAPEIRDFMLKEAADPVGGTPAETAAFFKREVERYAEVIRTAKIAIE